MGFHLWHSVSGLTALLPSSSLSTLYSIMSHFLFILGSISSMDFSFDPRISSKYLVHSVVGVSRLLCVHVMRQTPFHYRPQRSCEGYVFTGVCLSTGGGGLLLGGAWSWGSLVPGGSAQGGCLVRGCLVQGGWYPSMHWGRSPRRDGYCCGRYASYWNAFLFPNSLYFSITIHYLPFVYFVSWEEKNLFGAQNTFNIFNAVDCFFCLRSQLSLPCCSLPFSASFRRLLQGHVSMNQPR